MLEKLRATRTNQNGFTLIELLIVVVILGVLAGVVVFAVQAFNKDGVVAACQADKKNVEVATEAYYAKTGGYPGSTLVLKNGGYLREEPINSNYTVTTAGGTVASNLAGC